LSEKQSSAPRCHRGFLDLYWESTAEDAEDTEVGTRMYRGSPAEDAEDAVDAEEGLEVSEALYFKLRQQGPVDTWQVEF